MATKLTFLNATSAGNLGTIITERQNKASNLFQFPMPASDSDEAFLLDIMGVLKTVNLEGVKTDTAANLKTFIENLEATEDGSQGTGLVFTSSLLGVMSGKFYIDNFEWNYVSGEPTLIRYTISLIQGTT